MTVRIGDVGPDGMNPADAAGAAGEFVVGNEIGEPAVGLRHIERPSDIGQKRNPGELFHLGQDKEVIGINHEISKVA